MTTLTLASTGPLIATEDDARDIIGEAFSRDADFVVIPVERLAPEFFTLSTGLAGTVLQKFMNYQIKVAIIGDISAYAKKSAPLRDFVRESNKQGHVWFVTSLDELPRS